MSISCVVFGGCRGLVVGCLCKCRKKEVNEKVCLDAFSFTVCCVVWFVRFLFDASEVGSVSCVDFYCFAFVDE